MSDWQPIETAPTDAHVRLGKWEVFAGRTEWRESSGVAWSRGFFGRKRNHHGEWYTHWQHLPAPPEPEDTTKPL